MMLRSEPEVERLVQENQKLVMYEVSRYLKRYYFGDMESEDLVSWGMIGLLHAARAWDPGRTASFPTLACRAIQRMIIRGVRREWKPEQAAATVSLDEVMGAEEGAGAPVRFVHRMASGQNVEGELLVGERRAAVRAAVAALSGSERRLIERHYYQEVSITALAAELGVSRQGVYVRQRKALRQLRASLSGAAG
jgi:RNA polymerase sigma factor (sigma-70 family)